MGPSLQIRRRVANFSTAQWSHDRAPLMIIKKEDDGDEDDDNDGGDDGDADDGDAGLGDDNGDDMFQWNIWKIWDKYPLEIKCYSMRSGIIYLLI